MKAVVVTRLGGPEGLEYIEVDKPVPTGNQVLIRTQALSVNYADIKSRYGNYNGAGQPPFIPGLDVTGIIESVGENVQHLKVGQRVIAFPIPDSLDLDTAAACPIVSFTSYKLLADVGRMEPGETVLIHAAAGGVGTTVIQLAKLLGAGKVIGTVGDPRKEEIALRAGADHVAVGYDDFAQKVNEWTDGKGVDVILDSLAGSITERSLDCLAMYGRLVNFGNASGSAGQFATKDLHSSCRSVLGFSLGTTRNKRPHLLRPIADRVLPYLVEGKLQMKIGKKFHLSEAAEAHGWIESRQSTGKVILKV